MIPLERAGIAAHEQRPHTLVHPPLIHRMLHVFVQKHATRFCHFLADFKKFFFNFTRKFTNRLLMLRFYDPKHATTPVIRRDLLRPARPLPSQGKRMCPVAHPPRGPAASGGVFGNPEGGLR